MYAMSRTVVFLLLFLTAVMSTKNTKNSSSSRRVTSASIHMMKLYKGFAKNLSYSNSTLVDPRAFGADTIISYTDPVYGKEPNVSQYHEKFQFKMVKSEGEKVMATEFRLYKQRTPPGAQNSTYVVRLYRIISPTQGLDLLETRVLRSWDAGWQSFDITQAGKTWLESPSNNYGLELAVENEFNRTVIPRKAGFVGFNGPQEFHPFIVAFFKDDGKQENSYPSFMKAIPQRPISRSAERMRGDPRSGAQSRVRYCQRRSLYVDFKKLGWDSWVIVPSGYSAFYCEGECSFPLGSNMNATNHALVQTSVNVRNPKTVPNPCCVPTELSPISVLFYEDGKVALKPYNDMVVEACGCH